MSLNDVKLSKNGRKKNVVVFLIVLTSTIIVSASFASILSDSAKTDASGIWIESAEEDGDAPVYVEMSADYSRTEAGRSATAVDPLEFPSAIYSLDKGIGIGDPQDTKVSDGRYFGAITELWHRGSKGSADKLTSYGGVNTYPSGAVTENSSMELTGLLDDNGLRTVGAVALDDTAEIYQVYRIRGSWYSNYKLFKDAGYASEYESFEPWSDEQNFHGHGAYPSYMTDINFSITLRFSDLSYPTAAVPKEYTVKIYNYLLDKWDSFRVENTTFIETYAQGIYQTDKVILNRENVNFEPYFDPDDRLSILMRIGLEFSYRGSTGGILQEIDVDCIQYDYESESQTLLINFYEPGSPSNTNRTTWRKDPTLLVECKSNSSASYPDDRVAALGLFGLSNIKKEKLPFGPWDAGLAVSTETRGGFLYYLTTGKPNFGIAVFTRERTKVDFDWVNNKYYPTHNITCPNKWYANESDLVSEMGKIKEITWEINLTTSPKDSDALLSLPIDFEIQSIRTPFGDDATNLFAFTNDVYIGTEVTQIFGYGTYQIIATAPNYISFASITDNDYEPIAQTTYTSPVRHITQITNWDQLFSQGKIGSVSVYFETKSGDSVYFNTTVSETADNSRKLFRGQTTFLGSAVGVVDSVYIWTNGENAGVYVTQFVMLGSSSDAPFVKIFNPQNDARINEDSMLFVAIVAVVPEKIGFSLDGSTTFGNMKKGYYQGFEGASDLLQGYTYYSNIPVAAFEEESTHFVKVRAYEGLNDKKTERDVSFKIDKQATVFIDEIPTAYDDEPVTVKISVDDDVKLLQVYLDDNLIGRLKGDAITDEITIPKLNSGTYFLDIEARDDLGNVGTTSASFFVNQRNPTPFGTLFQWLSDFFKILFIMIMSLFGGAGVVMYAKNKRGKSKKCPLGTIEINGVCEVDF